MTQAPEGAMTRSGSWHAVTAAFLGWTLDAFDFFVVVFLVDTLAKQFAVPKAAIVVTLGATLAMRPVGALLFGLLADRFGRRVPLMGNIIFFSILALLCGFSKNYLMFLILRSLYGIGMGGEWGVGASLAMEAAPPRWRGLLSGILQSGYSIGYLLAAVAARFILPNLGWRWMFWIGGVPALLALYIRIHVRESEAWKQHKQPSFAAVLRTVAGSRYPLLFVGMAAVFLWIAGVLDPRVFAFFRVPPLALLLLLPVIALLFFAAGSRLFAYLCVLMTLFMFLSHGTQDLYPDFLRSELSLSTTTVAYLAIFYNVGAIFGAVIFGHLSQSFGRRYAIVSALALSLAVIPLWAFGATLLKVAVGSFLIQVGVQGAWGIIPAHLNELAPDSARGLVPGLAYQMGILFAAPTNTIEYLLRDRVGYRWALASFEISVMLLLGLVVLLGQERHGRSFVTVRDDLAAPAP